MAGTGKGGRQAAGGCARAKGVAWRGSPDLLPLCRPLAGLTLDPRNARAHTDESVEVIRKSLALFGQQRSIVVTRAGLVIAGNGVVRAARNLGWDRVAAAVFRGTADEARAYALADNRSAERSEWDYGALSEAVRELKAADFPVLELGWDSFEMPALLSGEWRPPDGVAEPFEGEGHPRTIHLSAEQWGIFAQAAERVREGAGEDEVPNGRVVELLAAEFLSG